jgi:hypothetical protein
VVAGGLAPVTLAGLFTNDAGVGREQLAAGRQGPLTSAHDVFGWHNLTTFDRAQMLPGVSGELSELHEREPALSPQSPDQGAELHDRG